ncbi:unnamed protein product, partial [Vitis vinifera]
MSINTLSFLSLLGFPSKPPLPPFPPQLVPSRNLSLHHHNPLLPLLFLPSKERRENQDINEELEDNHNPALHEPWHVATTGLDEALIKSITLCKYKKGDGLVEGTDCSVCLSEFEEEESLRLLPKCSHAFHVQCIDTWLKSHSNCPLCRANIVPTTVSPTQLPPPVMESPLNNEPSQQSQLEHENVAVGEDLERIRDEGEQQIRRSISLDYSCQTRLSVADILLMNEDEDPQMGDCDCQFPGHVGSSKVAVGEISKYSHRNRVLHCVMSPVSMKRSFSSGRLLSYALASISYIRSSQFLNLFFPF